MEDEELRHKQAMRPQHGLTARHEHIDFDAICIGWKGGMTQQLRTMTNCHIKQLRMDTNYAYHHTCITQGITIDHKLLKSKKEITKYLKKQRGDPTNQTCFHCSATKLVEYRTAKDSIDFNPTLFFNKTTEFEKDHPHQGGALHRHTCKIPATARARELANDYVELCLTTMYNTANEAMKNAYVSDKTPTLKNHLFRSLQRTELEPHLTTTEGKNMTRCATTTRKHHTTVMKNAQRVLIKDSRTNTTKIQESVQKWPNSIECGIFRPETMP